MFDLCRPLTSTETQTYTYTFLTVTIEYFTVAFGEESIKDEDSLDVTGNSPSRFGFHSSFRKQLSLQFVGWPLSGRFKTKFPNWWVGLLSCSENLPTDFLQYTHQFRLGTFFSLLLLQLYFFVQPVQLRVTKKFLTKILHMGVFFYNKRDEVDSMLVSKLSVVNVH